MSTTVEEDDLRTPSHFWEGGPPRAATAGAAKEGQVAERALVVFLLGLFVVCGDWVALAALFGR